MSYDGGESWIWLGQATGDPGMNGDTLFWDVWYDNTNVVFTLWDGTEITVPLACNGVSVYLNSINEFSVKFSGSVTNKAVDFRVSVYYGTNSNLSLYNYFACVTVNSVNSSSFSFLIDRLYSETTYYYFIETVNNGKTTYTAVNSFRTKAVTGYETDFQIEDAVSLSSDGTANCYIVGQAGTYSFPAVKGNSSTSVGSVATVDVLWETFGTSTTPSRGDLVKGARYQDGNVYFKTNAAFREGNVLLAAKNSSGTILWSWHIWMTDQPEEQVYYRNAGTMMDRNLGATSATPGDVGALGLMYQWGRKDPFMGSSSISSIVEAKSTISFPTVQAATYTVGTIEYAIKNPTTLIRGNNSNEWLYDEDDFDGLWASQKTMYDPCPAGWRVPDGGEQGVWYKAVGRTQITPNPFNTTTKGVNMTGYLGSDSVIWYPATGYYGKANGVFYGVGEHASYHSVTPGDTYGTLCFVIDDDLDRGMYMLYVTDFGGANPVRCCKE